MTSLPVARANEANALGVLLDTVDCIVALAEDLAPVTRADLKLLAIRRDLHRTASAKLDEALAAEGADQDPVQEACG